MSSVRFAKRAENDLDEIAEYLSARSPAAALRFADVVRDVTEILRSHPCLGAQNRRDPTVRGWLVAGFPHRLHYAIREGDLWVVHVRHTSRQS